MDAIQIQQLAITLSHMDPGVLEYHAEGRAREFLEGFDLDQILARITCPVLLLQGNPSLGGMMTNEVVKHVQSILPNATHVLADPQKTTSTGHMLADIDRLQLHYRAKRIEYEATLRSVGLKKGWKILDAGCGVGSFLPLMAKLGCWAKASNVGHMHKLA